MITIRDLMNLTNLDTRSVAYGNSRAILNNLDAEAISYGYGFNGFIAIYKNKVGFLKGVCCSSLHPFGTYPLKSFSDLGVDEAAKIISSNILFTDKYFDADRIKSESQKQQYKRPHIGQVKTDENNYDFYKLKDGRIRIEQTNTRYSWRKDTFCSYETFIDEIGEGTKIVSSTISKEILQKVKDTVVARQL